MRHISILVAAVLISGCDKSQPDEAKFVPAISAQAAQIVLSDTVIDSVPDNPSPSPDDKSCTSCKGTGKVKTGDGISWTECDECDGTGVATQLGYIELPAFQNVAFITTKDEDFAQQQFTPYIPETEIEDTTTLVAVADQCADGSCAVSTGLIHSTERVRIFHQHRSGRVFRGRLRGMFRGCFRGGC